jgi:hypothetical protein
MAAKPRTFELHWASGVIAEEVRVEGEYHVPAIQLLEFTEGEAAGTVSLRFCHYDHRGRFQRSPLIVGEADMAALRQALATAPRIRELLGRLLE